MASFIPKCISIHKVIKSQTHMRNPSMWNSIIHSKAMQQPKHGSKANHIINQNKALTSYTYIKGGLNKQHACTCEWMTYLTYLATSQHLWHCAWTCEWMIMVFNQDMINTYTKSNNTNLPYISTSFIVIFQTHTRQYNQCPNRPQPRNTIHTNKITCSQANYLFGLFYLMCW